MQGQLTRPRVMTWACLFASAFQLILLSQQPAKNDDQACRANVTCMCKLPLLQYSQSFSQATESPIFLAPHVGAL